MASTADEAMAERAPPEQPRPLNYGSNVGGWHSPEDSRGGQHPEERERGGAHG